MLSFDLTEGTPLAWLLLSSMSASRALLYPQIESDRRDAAVLPDANDSISA